MELSDVSNVLWRERQLLDLLVFKLDEVQLLLAAAHSRWLAYATREVENVVGEIERIELERAVLVAAVGRELGRSGSPTLRELGGLTPMPWAGIFAEHRRALLDLAQEVDSISKSNRDRLQRGHKATREAIAAMGEIDIDAYDAQGPLPDRSRVLRIVDETNPSRLTGLQPTPGTCTTQVRGQLAQVGSQFLRVQNMQSQNTSRELTMRQHPSSIEDADIAQVMVHLQTQRIAYQAALSATARAIQPSLTDFLK